MGWGTAGSVVIGCVWLALAATPAAADDATVLYDPGAVTTVDLSLSDDGEQALRDAPKTYTPAGLSLTLPDGRVLGPYTVGLKLKGSQSFRTIDDKAAFKVKFAEVVPKQKVLWLKGLTLNNMVQDNSMIHETLTYELFRAAGVPAPRTGYAYVRLNGVGKGIYLDLEPYDDVSLDRLFPTTQHLYEGEASADVAPDRRGEFSADEGDEDDTADLDALIAAAGAAGAFSTRMASVADLDEMTRMWAGESFTAHWDSYSLYGAKDWRTNNFYLHSDDAGRFTMLPSGADQTLIQWRKPIADGAGVLFTGCLGDPDCATRFRDALRAFSSAARAADIGTRATATAALVARWRTCPAAERPTDDQWSFWTSETFAFLRGRRAEVAGYLKEAAPTAISVGAVPPASKEACPAPSVPPTPAPTPTPPTPAPTPSAPAATPTAPSEPAPAPATTPASNGSLAPGSSPAPNGSTTTPAPPAGGTGPPAPLAGTGGVAGSTTAGGKRAPCTVPVIARVTAGAARRVLRAAGCVPGRAVRRTNGRTPKPGSWRVRRTRPAAGTVTARPVVVVLTPRYRQ